MSTPFFGRSSVDLANAAGPSPHLFSGPSARVLQWRKTFSLAPLILTAFFFQGWAAGYVLGAALCGALLAEAAGALLARRKPSYHDGEAVFWGLLSGILLPYSLPAAALFAAVFAAVFFGREIFGGFGQAPFFVPALGFLFLYLGAPELQQAFDLKQAQSLPVSLPFETGHARLMMIAVHPHGAALEDTSWLALFLGVFYLALKNRAGLSALYLAVFALGEILFKKSPPEILISGGLLIAAFYGLEHPAGRPLTRKGQLMFAAGAALLAVLIPARDLTARALAGILAMNCLSPWLDAIFRPRSLRAVDTAEGLV